MFVKDSAGVQLFDVVVLDLGKRSLRIERSFIPYDQAESFCCGYNEDESLRPSGYWAAPVPSTTMGTTLRPLIGMELVN